MQSGRPAPEKPGLGPPIRRISRGTLEVDPCAGPYLAYSHQAATPTMMITAPAERAVPVVGGRAGQLLQRGGLELADALAATPTSGRPRGISRQGADLAGLSRLTGCLGLPALVSQRAAGPARHCGKHLGYVGFDLPLASCRGDGDPVVAVDHEMPVADAVDLDRRDRFTAALGQRQPLPAEPRPVGGGPEAPVE